MNQTLKDEIIALLKQFNIYPRKSLGQHFLISTDILKKIINAAHIKKGDVILEIGPGIGVLTEELLKKNAKIIAVEIDPKIVRFLKKQFKKYKNLQLVEADVLKIEGLKLSSFDKIVANLPYQITSPTIREFLENEKLRPKIMVLMVQKEMAERICARPGDSKRGYLSLLVQYYGEPKIIEIVPRDNFYPIPKVESAILQIKIKNKEKNRINKEKLFRVIQAGFSQKRKKLRNSLSGGLSRKPGEIDKILQKAGIEPNLRAEDLNINDWINLNNILESN